MSNRSRRTVAAILAGQLLLAGGTTEAAGQEREGGAEALRVFLDCGRCDFDYLRTVVTFVNYVRDRQDGQVHVLVTRESTGGGGDAYTLDFVGLAEFEGRDDQLRFFTSDDATDDDVRQELAQILRLGLVRYAASTPLASEITVAWEPNAGGASRQFNARPEDDPWNFWF